MSRFNREFKLRIQVDGQVIEFGSPVKIVFDVLKSIAGGLNKATINVYNLNEKNRLALTKDNEQIKYIPITLSIGYENSIETIFKGSIQRGSNRKDGPDIVTELYCLDGMYDITNAFISTISNNDSINAILGQMPNTGTGKISKQTQLARPKVLVGDPATLLDSSISNGQTWFIRDEALYVLGSDEVTSSFVPEVSAETGMVSTPEREQFRITFETLMNPALKIGGLCSIKSKFAPHLNGVYKLETLTYSGDNYGQAWNQQCSGILKPNFVVI